MGFITHIREEIKVIRERDPAIHSDMEVFLYPSFKVMLYYRAAHRLYEKKHFFLARWISQRGARKTGIEIHPGARIGKGFFIDHGNGVIIGETTVIGDNVTIGDNSKIGAGSVVLKEVPPDSTVVGVPGRVVKRHNVALPQEELDQVHLPDPVMEDLAQLQHENEKLANRLIDLEQEVRVLKRAQQTAGRETRGKREAQDKQKAREQREKQG